MKLCIWPTYQLRFGKERVPIGRSQGLIMLALMSHRFVTVELLSEILWPDPDNQPDLWLTYIHTMINRLRRRLEIYGYGISDGRHSYARGRQAMWNGWRLEEPAEEWRLAA